MRSRQHAPPRRRSAAEWTQLVAAFQESGLSPEEFAVSQSVPVSRLRWWKWHLGAVRRSSPTPIEELRLVPVVVEPSVVPDGPPPAVPAWEVCTSRGDVLRVYSAVAPAEIQAALSALLPPGGRS
jgi:hypothetical protein